MKCTSMRILKSWIILQDWNTKSIQDSPVLKPLHCLSQMMQGFLIAFTHHKKTGNGQPKRLLWTRLVCTNQSCSPPPFACKYIAYFFFVLSDKALAMKVSNLSQRLTTFLLIASEVVEDVQDLEWEDKLPEVIAGSTSSTQASCLVLSLMIDLCHIPIDKWGKASMLAYKAQMLMC